ncbi:MAG: flagellar export chaperone FliS [Syntrophales bacterium]|jgi:flagellar protein FliS|nr:flagellar export chaperone FliS [Syntrophales bacterium]MDY0043354.1 flagellar export chaperone FliS [Syntrophales bacterium]
MYGKEIAAYRQTCVVTADPRKLIILCYEDTLTHLRDILSAYESGDYEKKGNALAKVQEIVTFLILSLDHDRGAAVAHSLHSIYTYILRRLMEADMKRDYAIFEEVIHIVEELLVSWKQISSSVHEVQQKKIPEGKNANVQINSTGHI